jgi:archaellum component FlaC
VSCEKVVKRATIAALLAILIVFPMFSAVPVKAQIMTINLSQDSGPIVTKVVANGTLENPGAHFSIFWDYIKDWDGRYGLIAEGYAEGYNYSAVITVPPTYAGDHIIIVEDDKNHATTYAAFTVTPEITVDPNDAPSGANVNVSGRLIHGETIDIKFYDQVGGDEIMVAQTLTDNVTGELSCSLKIPLKPEGDYAVRAYWNGSLQAEAPFHVGYQGITVKPSKDPPNAIVTVSGGLAINENFTIAFANSTWSVDAATAQTDTSGQFTVNVTVPEASPGDYTVKAHNDGVEATAPFTILPPAQITATSNAANPSEALSVISVVTVNGTNFIANEAVKVYFESTPIQVAETTTDSNGSFTVTFNVPADASAGTHTISAVQDPYNVSASTTITVHSVVIKPYSTVYVPGDTICFSINSTTSFQAYSEIVINIFDPSGVPCTRLGYHVDVGKDIVQVNGFWVATYESTAFWPDIPKGAPVGMWTWNATYCLTLYPNVQMSASGVFYVIPEPDLYYILQRLNQIEAKIDGVVYKQDQLYVLIQTNQNAVMARLDQLEASLVSITLDGFAGIDTKLGELKVKVDMLDMKVTDIQNGLVSIQTSIGVMTADVATIKDILAQTNATVAEIKDGIATIKTDVGSIKADLTALNAAVTDIKNEVVKVSTSIGTLNAKLDAINATITGFIEDAEDEVLAKLSTSLGDVTVQLGDLKAIIAGANSTISGLIVGSKGEVMAKIEAGDSVVQANLNALNISIASVQEGVATVNTAVGDLKVSLENLGANVTQLIIDSENRTIVQMQTLLGSINATLEDLGGKITAIHGNVADVVVPGLGQLKVTVASTQQTSESASEAVSGMNTLMYAVVALSLVAAAISAVNLITIRRKEAAS